MIGVIVKLTVPVVYGSVQIGELVAVSKDMKGMGFKASREGGFDSGIQWSEVELGLLKDCCRRFGDYWEAGVTGYSV